jgi:formylglycine-generating enzyme required for sulfatase activity
MADPTSPGNNANYYTYDYLIGSPYYRTEVGEFQNSGSPYGTFDQGGNIYEWNEALTGYTTRGMRGGWFGREIDILRASYRGSLNPTVEYGSVGFRVSQVPEPSSVIALLSGLTAVIGLRRRKA